MLRTLYQEPGYVLSSWRNVLMNRWTGPITLEALAAGRDAGEELERAFGPKIGALTIIGEGMPAPSDAVRKQAAQDMRNAKHRIVAAATVIEGSGFRASALRSAYATLNLFARSSHPTKVVASVEDGARFVGQTLGHEAPDIDALVIAAHAVSA